MNCPYKIQIKSVPIHVIILSQYGYIVTAGYNWGTSTKEQPGHI